ncbi:putative RNA recognition motif domain, nucleotide-binding alpha-beta plait domain superfamily [Helianthus annuus]|nr:putative RNA recognition motif domain, nucleotide-binding alpha-beta plait domain superfamily [Helianthus annuus]
MEGETEGGPWSEYHSKSYRKRFGRADELTFYVSNLPDRVSKTLLWRAFLPHGRVSDAYVARKRDSRGNCFGFIRCVGISDVDGTLASMNTVKIFEAKLCVSVAKYDKNHQKFVYPANKPETQTWRPKVVPMAEVNGDKGGTSKAAEVCNQPGRLYSDVVDGVRKGQGHQKSVIVVSSDGPAFPNIALVGQLWGRLSTLGR